MIRLNRHHIFLIGVITAFLFAGIHILNYFRKSEFTKGKLIAWEGTYHTTYPRIQFKVANTYYDFLGESNLNLESDSNIDVIYEKENPKNAAIYTFQGFYMYYFYWLILPLILFTAFIYSWFGKYDRVLVDFRKKKVSSSKELIRK